MGRATEAPATTDAEPEQNQEVEAAAKEPEAESSSGVIDLRQRAARNVLQTNAVVWSDLVVGAVGVNDSNDQRSYYAGAYVQPLSLLPPRAGEWVTGANAIKTPDGTSHEVQTEYRCPFGFGLGGGYFEPAEGRLWRFGKVSFDHAFGPIRVVTAAVLQDAQGSLWPGGYGGVIPPRRSRQLRRPAVHRRLLPRAPRGPHARSRPRAQWRARRGALDGRSGRRDHDRRHRRNRHPRRAFLNRLPRNATQGSKAPRHSRACGNAIPK